MNKPQLLANIIYAREMWLVWGRGTGKSEGVIAPIQLRNVFSMPRSLGINTGATFSQILTRTLPAVIKGWEKLGYRRDEHFFIGQYAPKAWGWPRPYFAPIDSKYVIHWNTGAAIQMVSQDGHGMAAGMSVDYIHGDETKHQDYTKLHQEILPTLRGNNHYFGHLPQHRSLLFTTDRPTTPKSMWILEKAKLHNPEATNLIIELQFEINRITQMMPSYTPATQKQMRAQLARYEKQIALLRMNCVYYSEASSLSNIHALGLDFIKQMKRNLSSFDFETSILNRHVRSVEKSFYPKWDEHVHCYERYNYSHFESVGYNFDQLSTNDCRKDGDLIPDQGLDIAIDYNASINIMAVGQQRNIRQEDIIKEFYVKAPQVLGDLIKPFVEYYRFHGTKVVNYYYDHTAVAKSPASRKSYKDIVCEGLKAAGWTVKECYTGQAPGHEEKHTFWNEVLEEKNPALPIIRMNRENCPALKRSIEDAGWKQSDDGFKKDKSPERNAKLAQEHTTHGSDTVDQLIWGKFKSGFNRAESDFIDNIYV